MMETLSTLLREYQETKRVATEELAGIDPRVRPGRESAKANAAERLQHIANRYAEKLRQASFSIFVIGDGASFAEIANVEGGALTVDAAALYKRFADAIEPTIGPSRQFGTQQFLVLLQQMRHVGNELNLREIDVPAGIETRIVPDRQSLQEFVQSFVETSSTGIGLNINFMERQALESAFSNESEGNVVPVVVLNTKPDDIERLGAAFLNGQFIRVDLTPEGTPEGTNKDLVISTFNSITKILKSKKTN